LIDLNSLVLTLSDFSPCAVWSALLLDAEVKTRFEEVNSSGDSVAIAGYEI
jgi:hypothetical protein